MNSSTNYFISLINSHLNASEPALPDNVQWEEIYRLAEINNISGIIANEILKLNKKYQPESKILSEFRQQLGYTLIDFEEKERAVDTVKAILNELKIDHIFIKGEIIKHYYPVKELRTSADTDIIIKSADLSTMKKAFEDKGYVISELNEDVFFSLKINNQSIEIHSNLDYDNEYFINIFDYCQKNGCEYRIDDYNHLLYVICHIIKHFKYCGAGIKMFMDIDVIIRHISDFDYNRFMKMCRELNIEMFGKAALSLCSYMFNTPVKAEIDFERETEFRQLFESEIINGGSFGFSKRDLSSYYTITSAKNGKASRLKAFFALLFPDKEYLKKCYSYAKKHPALLPVAWLNRLAVATFKNGSHSVKTISSIAQHNDNSYIALLNELELFEKD